MYPEREENPHIYTVSLPVIRPEDARMNDWMEEMHWLFTASQDNARKLATYMCNNTPCVVGGLSVQRALSSYFSINLTLPEPVFLIEMGLITTDGSAKLHDYLNQNVNYFERHRQGYHLVSGHFAQSSLGSIALLDQLCGGKVYTDTQAILVASLIGNSVLPVGGDGIPLTPQ